MTLETEMRHRIDTWLSTIPGGDRVALSAAGQCTLQQAGYPDVTLQHLSESSELFFYAPIMRPSVEAQQAIFAMALSMNLYGRFTRGGLIALDHVNGILVYNYRLDFRRDPGVPAEVLIGEAAATAARIGEELQAFASSPQGQMLDDSAGKQPAIPDEFVIRV